MLAIQLALVSTVAIACAFAADWIVNNFLFPKFFGKRKLADLLDNHEADATDIEEQRLQSSLKSMSEKTQHPDPQNAEISSHSVHEGIFSRRASLSRT